MRCHLHAFLLFVVFTFLSLLYVFSQLAPTLEDRDEWGEIDGGTAGRTRHQSGHVLRKTPGLAGLEDRGEGPER